MARRRSPPGTGTGLKSAPLISVKTMVLRPIPRARVATTAAENQRREAIIRRAKRRSFSMNKPYAGAAEFVRRLRVRQAISKRGLERENCLRLLIYRRIR